MDPGFLVRLQKLAAYDRRLEFPLPEPFPLTFEFRFKFDEGRFALLELFSGEVALAGVPVAAGIEPLELTT